MLFRIRIVKSAGLAAREEFCRRYIEFGIYALIIISPLPAASTFDWSIMAIALIVVSMGICYFLSREKPEINRSLGRFLRWPKFIFLGLFAYILLQAIPFPKGLISLISPETLSLHQNFSYKVGEVSFLSVSFTPFLTIREGLELFSYFVLGFLIVKTVISRRQVKRIIYVLIGMGLFESLYGIFELNRSNPRILFYEKTANLNNVTGTFINQNHLAGYLEMIIPLAVGLIIANIDLVAFLGKPLRGRLLHLVDKGMGKNLILLAAVFVMAIAILLSRSRSALFLILLTFFLFLALSSYFFGKLSKARPLIRMILHLIFIGILVVFLYMGIDATLDRFAGNILEDGRPQYWANMVSMIKDFPLLGCGLGSFAYVYPVYENEYIHAFLVHAHNDYLEYMVELGLAGMLLLAGGIFIIARQSFKVWKRRKNPEVKGIGLGGLISLMVIGSHSITDFNLHIPANMLLFTVILSLTLVMSHYRLRGRKSRKRRKQPERQPDRKDEWNSREYQISSRQSESPEDVYEVRKKAGR